MAKYIVDLDSLIDCLEFTREGKINGHDYAFVQNVRCYIERFPKQAVEETVRIIVERDIEATGD